MIIMVGYLLLLTVAATAAKRTTDPLLRATPRFAILIPAHNEEQLLPSSLSCLGQMDYPREAFDIHVVADNCTDQTAKVAAKCGAIVHPREDLELRGKGHALNWLYDRLLNSGARYDAFVILDADTLVSNNFLRVMASRLARGERIVQAYYTVRNPGNSWTESLRMAALALLHYVRPQGRMVLGGSAGLKGNGMVFVADVLTQRRWSASVTEDIELHMQSLLEGERVMLAPDAVVWGEMPDNLAKSHSQHTRWERGRLEMARSYVPQLWMAAWRQLLSGNFKQAFVCFDASMEHIIPPFSVLAGLSLGIVLSDLAVYLSSIWWPDPLIQQELPLLNLALGMLLLGGQFVYLFGGLWIARAPKVIYKNLIFAPILVGWKLGHYVRVLLGRTSQGWVRTRRNEV